MLLVFLSAHAGLSFRKTMLYPLSIWNPSLGPTKRSLTSVNSRNKYIGSSPGTTTFPAFGHGLGIGFRVWQDSRDLNWFSWPVPPASFRYSEPLTFCCIHLLRSFLLWYANKQKKTYMRRSRNSSFIYCPRTEEEEFCSLKWAVESAPLRLHVWSIKAMSSCFEPLHLKRLPVPTTNPRRGAHSFSTIQASMFKQTDNNTTKGTPIPKPQKKK